MQSPQYHLDKEVRKKPTKNIIKNYFIKTKNECFIESKNF